MSGVSESRFLVQNESCHCKCGINESVYNSKQKWNHNKYRCKCNELDDWGSCENAYMWNHRMYDCKCNKACKIEEYLGTKNCSCEKRLVGKLWRCNIKCEDEILNVNMKMKY